MITSHTETAVITETLENYFRSICEGDVNTLAKYFHKGTLLWGDVKGQPYARTLDQYLDGVENRLSPKDSGQPFLWNILSIDIINSIAMVKVHVKMYDFNYDEFLSFHKINNNWIIVSKMISDVQQ
ncbi:nuclear transport factor 2 family protein [Cytophagaceae bacterium YF14B1]|uniref:Nuclear transport factor 2 family protein n=1 Tax=Xanthocytophaga flava TaxID=3048013 RepID=A0AAE3U5T7_9BACT|nr:nuclear transport factor 2 family protein [Xanthocytophaga flavus]MDJ1479867.1 nuclear transport factor 2 family protein [Xanthocytophaga flavus]